MKRWFHWKGFLALGALLPILAGCGGGDGGPGPIYADPGLVGIENRPTVALTAPELTVEYLLPGVPGTFVVSILSDQPTDGDIAYDPVLASYTITQAPSTLLIGVDSATLHELEYRAFLDFPLDGSTGEPIIPSDAIIRSATLTVFVNSVEFAANVPILLDLIQYSVNAGLSPGDYSSALLAVRAFHIYHSDVGGDVVLDVTPLMATAQDRGLLDFQVRFLLGP